MSSEVFAVENSILLGCDDAPSGNQIQMFQRNVLSSSLGISKSLKNALALVHKEKQHERTTRKNKNQYTNLTSHALQLKSNLTVMLIHRAQ